jgi:hypothetical protein
VKQKIEALASIHLMNNGHEAILVRVVDLRACEPRLLEPTGIVDDDISPRELVQLREVLPPDDIVNAPPFTDLLK